MKEVRRKGSNREGVYMNNLYLFIQDFFTTENGDLNPLGKAVKIVIIFISIKIVSRILNSVIDRSVNRRVRNVSLVEEKKIRTLVTVFKNVLKYILYFIGIVVILDMFGVNTSSILATAGIGGLAISFGAQSLVKDIITGFFILFEDQYSVGDYITIGDYTGVVEEVGVRVTKLRDFSGELHIIPNGSINVVTNMGRGPMRSLVRVRIPYEEDVDKATRVIEGVLEKIKKENDNIVDGPSVLGVTSLEDTGVIITIIAKTKPMEQWALERQMRKAIKEAFDRENIKFAYPRMIVYNGKP